MYQPPDPRKDKLLERYYSDPRFRNIVTMLVRYAIEHRLPIEDITDLAVEKEQEYRQLHDCPKTQTLEEWMAEQRARIDEIAFRPVASTIPVALQDSFMHTMQRDALHRAAQDFGVPREYLRGE